MAAFIGIDLGTTFSAVSTLDETGRPVIVHNQNGENITPSCVAEYDGKMVVGKTARNTWGVTPDKAAARFKRDMGTSIKHTINGNSFTPTKLSAYVLKKLAKDAAHSIGPIGEAVVTIPANFANEAREATMKAAEDAGLNVKYIINEPTAAALYYAYRSGGDLYGNFAVYDLGGGTFDISIIHIDGHNVEVLVSNGVSKLGGDDFDEALVKLVAQKYKDLKNEEMEFDDYTKNEAEKEKISLSERKRATAKAGRQHIDITRDEFESAISGKVAQAEMLCEATLEEAKLEAGDIRNVLLAGGSTRIPMVRESIKRVFKQEPVSIVNVDEVVALGAVIYAAHKGDQSQLSAIQKNAFRNVQVLERTATCYGTIIFAYDSKREQRSLQNTILIPRGEKIPFSVTESFYTIYEGQEGVDCRVTETTHAETDPRFVKVIWEGELELPPGRPAQQEIRITFAYNDNQIMRCSFVDVATGRETKIDLTIATFEREDNDEDENIKKIVVE
jgi:molecular chaperone DnaK